MPGARSLFSPLVQASAPRTVRGRLASATLSKPLVRECLVYLFRELLSKFPGSGLYVSRKPHLPRMIRLVKILYNTGRKSCQVFSSTERSSNKKKSRSLSSWVGEGNVTSSYQVRRVLCGCLRLPRDVLLDFEFKMITNPMCFFHTAIPCHNEVHARQIVE